jgi:uncharacterized membrane protein YkgB
MSHRPEHRGTGWIVVSAILLILAGANILINGLFALHANATISNNPQVKDTLLFSSNNLDTWGWIYTIVGAVIILAGLGVFVRARWAVATGMLAAVVGMVMAFFWLFTPYWPDALISILLAGVVIHGLARYGYEEMAV